MAGDQAAEPGVIDRTSVRGRAIVAPSFKLGAASLTNALTTQGSKELRPTHYIAQRTRIDEFFQALRYG